MLADNLSTILISFLVYLALNAFVFRLYFDKNQDNPDHLEKSAKQARFSMNLINVAVLATGMAIWFVSQVTLQDKLSIALFAAVAGSFVYAHMQLMKHLVEEADRIIGMGLNFLVFTGVFLLTIFS